VRTWSSPDPEDDGISLMAKTLLDLPRRHGKIGWEFGREMLVRAPKTDVDRMAKKARGLQFADGAPVIWRLRQIKSAGEIDRIRVACAIASDAYDDVPRMTRAGDTTREAELRLRRTLMEKGADHVPFLATAAGAGGYAQIIAGPGDHELKEGDVLFHDIGCTYDGYFSDFDRNFAVGKISEEAKSVHEVLWQATEAGMTAARPGKTMQDVFHVMARFLEEAGSVGNNVGRIGHGLGMHLTEPPSFMLGDLTPIAAGMVLTIEPGMAYAPGKMLVHEENIAIGRDGNELLTRRAPREMPVLSSRG
jgi:Xaa-Pro aminopeptidase